MANKEPNPVSIGIALRQGRECPALCVAERERRPERGGHKNHYVVRHLERLAARTSYVAVAARAGEMAGTIKERGGRTPELFVEATGRGHPVVDLFREDPRTRYVMACYFNHGDQRVREKGLVVRIGKAFLVANLQALLQCRRLHLPRTEESEQLAQELLDFEIQVAPNADNLSGAFPVGSRDELVTALGLAVGGGPPRPTKLVY